MLGIKCSHPVHEEPDIPYTSELCSQSLDFSIERLCRCIGKPFLKIVNDGIIVVLKGFNNLVEAFISKIFDIIVPSGKVKPCYCRQSPLVENVHKTEVETIRLLKFGKHLK